MEIPSEQDKQTLKNAVELLWKKGTHHPQEAAIAFEFTRLVERLLTPKPPMLQNADAKVPEKG